VALRAIFASLRRRARREGVRDARAGAVTFVQRFGGALNLNVHFHCVVPDGVFAGEEPWCASCRSERRPMRRWKPSFA
jgi:hypothetical protein